MEEERRDPRTIRLFDLAPHEVIRVQCECGHITEYGYGVLQRLHRFPSDTLVCDPQFRLRCAHRNRKTGFWISIIDPRGIHNSFTPIPELVVVEGEERRSAETPPPIKSGNESN